MKRLNILFFRAPVIAPRSKSDRARICIQTHPLRVKSIHYVAVLILVLCPDLRVIYRLLLFTLTSLAHLSLTTDNKDWLRRTNHLINLCLVSFHSWLSQNLGSIDSYGSTWLNQALRIVGAIVVIEIRFTPI